jgi:hypothetical protein
LAESIQDPNFSIAPHLRKREKEAHFDNLDGGMVQSQS